MSPAIATSTYRVTRILGPVAQAIGAVAIVLTIAGEREVPFIGWYLAVMFGFSLFDQVLRKEHPSVIAELTRADVSMLDRLVFVGGGLLLAIHFVLAIADASHYQWSGVAPHWVRILGLVGMALGYAFAAWAMLLNPFFSPIVRVQRDRGHRVVTDGPYRVVRHPAYLGISVGSLASGLALGSYWSLAPVVAFILIYARRAWVEDIQLRRGLVGFDAYAKKVRYRMLPLVY